MTTGQIQGALKDLKPPVTQKQIANDLDVSEQAVSSIIRMDHVSDRIMQHIAILLGKEPWEVWDYYKQRPKRSTSKTLAPFQPLPARNPQHGTGRNAA